MEKKPFSDILLNEMIEDMDRIGDSIEQFADRWGRYGKQFRDDLSPNQKVKFDMATRRFLARIEAIQ